LPGTVCTQLFSLPAGLPHEAIPVSKLESGRWIARVWAGCTTAQARYKLSARTSVGRWSTVRARRFKRWSVRLRPNPGISAILVSSISVAASIPQERNIARYAADWRGGRGSSSVDGRKPWCEALKTTPHSPRANSLSGRQSGSGQGTGQGGKATSLMHVPTCAFDRKRKKLMPERTLDNYDVSRTTIDSPQGNKFAIMNSISGPVRGSRVSSFMGHAVPMVEADRAFNLWR
jgi:hypothetical protein